VETVGGERGRKFSAFFTLVTQAPGSFEISGPFVDSVHSIGHNIYMLKPTPRALLSFTTGGSATERRCQTYSGVRYCPTAHSKCHTGQKEPTYCYTSVAGNRS